MTIGSNMNFDIGIVGVAKSENFGGSLAYYMREAPGGFGAE
jgi:hypothetical protein